jgi:hypothetical protein
MMMTMTSKDTTTKTTGPKTALTLSQRLQKRIDAFTTILEEVCTFARALVVLCFDTLLVLFIVGIVVRRLVPEAMGVYIVIVLVPLVAAFATVFQQLITTDYLQTAISYGLKRVRLGRAGLAFITSTSGKVLLNRQRKDPWMQMWCLPGGYFRVGQDEFIEDTVRRRVERLVKPEWEFEVKAEIGETNDSAAYRQLIQDLGYHPIKDQLFEIRRLGQRGPIDESDVIPTEYLKWWSYDEIRDGLAQVPPHMADIIGFMVQEKRQADYWKLRNDVMERQIQETQ